MRLKTIRLVITLIVLTMTVECMSAALSQTESRVSYQKTIQALSTSSFLHYIFFEKAEEESKNSEEKTDRLVSFPLIDFSRIAISLSHVHSPQVDLTPYQHRFGSYPSRLTLHCILLI
jgi:hypothetical protein